MRRSKFVRRSAVAATAVSLALLVTACGGEAKDDAAPEETAKADSSAPAADAPAPAAEVLSADELEKALVVQGDVEGFKVKKPMDAALKMLETGSVTTDKAECEPLARLVISFKLGEPAATAATQATAELDKKNLFDMKSTMIGLSSYEGKGAEETLASVRTAGGACADGFTYTVGAETTKVTKVEELKVSGGDEATGWVVTTEVDGEKMPYHAGLVRQGSTLAAFPTLNLGSAVTGKDSDFPAALATAQVEKLAKQG
ncbi:hypothetical protein I3F58_23110 [Streptomyces sp. MUM 203J]|uniref:hypothetical protein n=1 Tax=Streptomyces sp. MUM 203J TaxID=2791990 RepID=UPI001F032FDF|nr:hypothetical protein [Streptomyces sp. MUM 203J]MCH0542388.1 hypothetical protein [Streptomyces sp. MUM 203J]